MMHQSGRFLLADCPSLGATALVLPYRHSGAVMVLFLPQDLYGLGALQEQLSVGAFELQFRECDVDVSLPRFRLRQVRKCGEGDMHVDERMWHGERALDILAVCHEAALQ
ncbi:hypothetical protein HPB51_027731 [Rhipicephalus microplus]|uniref:Serpin domain-containing protein n=1 Tax=Rhipicephalus microplus TaxID=6941 RepID=A0A9J6CZA2_RHIMP|nr:hypothetical protein HPB51_027731 [Rhipicephalus microplus]